MTLPAFKCSSGPHNAKIAIVGEAFGEEEDKVKIPFVDHAGQELTRMLSQVGLSRRQCFLTNVFALRPHNNDITKLCGNKKDTKSKLPPLMQGKYLWPEHQKELLRLKEEIDTVAPNVVIALGNTASWALLGTTGISNVRGTLHLSELCPGIKVLPTYHPSAVLRNYSLRTIVIADLGKAKDQSEFPEIRRPLRKILIDPTIEELRSIAASYLDAQILSVDIETGARQIKTISFSPSRSESLVIPFVDLARGEGSFWTFEEECEAWDIVAMLLESPVPKLFQNGLYDLQYLTKWGLKVMNCAEDTMLLHHSLYPEMQKGLGFLGSIYTQEVSWKQMRKHHSDDGEKADE